MKYRLVELLACPHCGGRLSLNGIKEEKASLSSEDARPRCSSFCAWLRLDLDIAGPQGMGERCKGCYHREIVEGTLVCGCGTSFPIRDGVPMLLPPPKPELAAAKKNGPKGDKATTPRIVSESFSYEWEAYRYGSLTWEMDLEERKDFFLRYLKTDEESLRGALVLDAGCGNGTLTAVLTGLGVETVGMDISRSVFRAQGTKEGFAPTTAHLVHFVQGDIMTPPFRQATFDIVYADGVLHHTPSTSQAFLSLAPLAKRGGRYFVWLYRRDLPLRLRPKQLVLKVLQSFTWRLPHPILFRICTAGALPLLVLVRLRRLLGDKGRRLIPLPLKAVNLFDTLSPRYNHAHTFQEISGWFAEAGYSSIADVTIDKTSTGWGLGVVGTLQQVG